MYVPLYNCTEGSSASKVAAAAGRPRPEPEWTDEPLLPTTVIRIPKTPPQSFSRGSFPELPPSPRLSSPILRRRLGQSAGEVPATAEAAKLQWLHLPRSPRKRHEGGGEEEEEEVVVVVVEEERWIFLGRASCTTGCISSCLR